VTGGYLERPAPSGLADVVETILDKGIVIDAYVRVSFVGIELLTIDARVVIASVDTYLRFAEATNRLDLYEKGGKDLTDLFEDVGGPLIEKIASDVVQHKVEGGIEKVQDAIEGGVEKVEDVVEDVAGVAKKVAKKAKDVLTPD
jgi:hypothetical protein